MHYHHFGTAERLQIFQRVLAYNNHLRHFALFNRPCYISDSGKSRIEQSRGINGKTFADSAEFHIIIKLSPHIILRYIWASGICSETDGNSLFQTFLCKRNDSVKNNFAVLLLLISCMRDRAVKQSKRKRRRNCGHLKSFTFFEQFHNFFGRLCAVFNRINAVFQRNLHPFWTFNVRRYLKAEFMCPRASGFHDLGRHSQNARFAYLFRIQNTACDHKLYDIRLVLCNNINIACSFLRR